MHDPTEKNLLQHVVYAARALQTTFDTELKAMGLTAARGRVLFYLARNPDGATQSDVTAFLRVENATAVRILDGLETLGYIARRPSDTDRRAKVIVLTDPGKPIAEQVVKITRKLNKALLDNLDQDEMELTSRVLRKIMDNIANAGCHPTWLAGEREMML